MLFNLDFANNTIISCFFFFLSVIDLYFLNAAAIAQIFNPIAELVIPIEIPTKEVKAEMKTHSIILEAKIRKYAMLFRVVQTYLRCLLMNSF